MSKQLSFEFQTKFARRVPDPVFHKQYGMERHFFFVPVSKVPKQLPMDPNARVPNIRRTVYKEVRESLLNPDGRFHLKHKGITVVASAVEKRSDTVYLVKLGAGQGVLDGGHSYTLIIQEQDEGNLPENQFVKFEIVTGAPLAWIAEMAGGLNTSVQVQNMSLDNLEGRFDWLKKVLAGQPYEKQIAWRENEDNEFDARDLISLLTCFNTELFPNDVSDTQPVVAYEKKSAALKLYENNQPSYERMAPIVNDILRLHDTIRSDARSHWNDEGGAFGKLAFVETRKKGFYLPFDGKTVEYRLMSGAVYPILAAFRWMVDTDPKSKKSRWRGGFASVKALWQDSAVELLKMTKQASDELGRNPNAIGKSRNHWANLFARVAMRDLTRRMNR
jgi:hypothetical protein